MIYTASTKLIIPEGKKTGCLYRTDRPGDNCVMLEEGEQENSRIKLIDPDDWGPHIGTTPRRDSIGWIFDQDGVGSCAAESATGNLSLCEAKQGREVKKLSPWYVYHTTSGGRDGGSNIGSNLKFLRDNGVCEMSLWPRSKGWRATPSKEANENAKLHRLAEYFECTSTTAVGTALIKDFGVCFGWQGHACYLIDLIDERTARYVNSWGDWGDKGCGSIRLDAINFGYGCYAYRTAA